MRATIYHNPRCSKSRQTLALLKEKGIAIEIIDYLKTPPDAKTLKSILKKIGIDAPDLIRKKESLFNQLALDKKLDDTDALLDAMINNPILIERPIVLFNNKAAIGRPPETVLNILN